MQKKNNKILPLLIVILLLSAVLVFLVIKLNGVDTGDTNEPDIHRGRNNVWGF